MDLRDVVKELKRANKEDSLEEQAALLLNLPAKLRKICERLYARPQVVKLPHFRPVQAPSVAGVLKCLAAEMPPKGLVSHVLRSVKALAGEVVAPGNGNLFGGSDCRLSRHPAGECQSCGGQGLHEPPQVLHASTCYMASI